MLLGVYGLIEGYECSQDSDCACINGQCYGSDYACDEAADCLSTCEGGYCVTNLKACGKQSGVSCDDLTPGNAPCNEFWVQVRAEARWARRSRYGLRSSTNASLSPAA